jgi:serine/threonine-protein kinase
VDGGPFFVMDYVAGRTLRQIIDDRPIEPARALALGRQVLAGLAHAHERGVIHRDVKPANIMVAAATATGDQVRILDFGLAKLVGVDATTSTLVVGTPSYMSPEQAGGKSVDGRADVYAATCVLYELLTGEKPFASDQAVHVIKMHLEKPAPPLGRGFSDALEAVIARGMAKDPGERFQTPGELAAALAAVPETKAGQTPAPVAVVEPPPRKASGGGSGLVVGIVIVALLAGGAVFAWQRWQGGKPDEPAVSSTGEITLTEANRLAEAGDRDGAIAVLHELRRRTPGVAKISARLGQLYAEKGWRAESVAAYREAVESDAAFAKDVRLQKDVIAALQEEVSADKAEQLLIKRIGTAALPRLREAMKTAKPAAKERLGRIVAALGR